MGIPVSGGFSRPAESDSPLLELEPITLGTTVLASPVRALLVETAGRVNLTQLDGTVRANVPLIAGYNPIVARFVTSPSAGTAATGVWGGR